MDSSNLLHQFNDCWNRIGVEGDRSCVELETVIHCRNCPVYSQAGRSLLERVAPCDYLNEWTAILAGTQRSARQFAVRAEPPHATGSGGGSGGCDEQAQEEPSGAEQQTAFRIGRSVDTLSIIIFRLSDELFALPVRVLHEVTHPCVIHTLPHRSNDLLLGLVNIRGEILLCASLTHLLGLDETNPVSSRMKRMLVVGHEDSKWVFPVDEVQRISRIHLNELKATPVVISQAKETYTQGVIDWQNKKVNYLDTELLDTLARRIL